MKTRKAHCNLFIWQNAKTIRRYYIVFIMIGQKGTKSEKRAHFIEYLRSIFGNDEHINSFADIRSLIDSMFASSCNFEKTDVDHYYEMVVGLKKPLIFPAPHKLQKEESKEEETKAPIIQSRVPFLEKCRKIGKLGPLICMPNLQDAFGNIVHKDDEELDVQCKSPFGSIRANTCVFSGAWYYEIKLITSGLMHIGWATNQTPFSSEAGVGDSNESYAYDGYRVAKWNLARQEYGEAWTIGILGLKFLGDIIGCYIDLNKKEISYSRNGNPLGIAFKNIAVGEGN